MSRPAAFALLLFVELPVLAANPPALTNYQGVLRSADDGPLTGDSDKVFRVFDAEAAGSGTAIEALGPYGGGYFGDSDDSGYAYIGYGDYGMQSFGTQRRSR